MKNTGKQAPDSFVQVQPDSHFSLQNLPFGIGRPQKGEDQTPRVYSRIGNYAVDLSVFEQAGYFDDVPLGGRHIFKSSSLKDVIGAGPEALSQIQQITADLLRFDRPMWLDKPELRDEALTLLEMVEMQLPVAQNRGRLIAGSDAIIYHMGNFDKDDDVGFDEKKTVSVKIGHEILLDHHGDQMLPELGKCENRIVKEAGLAYLCGPGPNVKDEGEAKSNHQIAGVTVAVILLDAHQKAESSQMSTHIIVSPWVTLLDRLTPFISPQTHDDDGSNRTDTWKQELKRTLKLNCSVELLDNQLGLVNENITNRAFPIINPFDVTPDDGSGAPHIQSGDLIMISPTDDQANLETPFSTMYSISELLDDFDERGNSKSYVQISAYGDTGSARLGTGKMLIRI